MMRGVGPFVPALLLLAALPLQPTSASPSSWFEDRAWAAQTPLSASKLIQDTRTFVRNGLNTLTGPQSVCQQLGTLLNQLSGAGTITLSTNGPPSPDNSLLQNAAFWGNLVQVQHATYPMEMDTVDFGLDGRSQPVLTDSALDMAVQQGIDLPHPRSAQAQIGGIPRVITGGVLYAVPQAGQSVSLTQVLFPAVTSNLPPHKLLNLTFDCNTNQLDVHIQISSGVKVIPSVLSFTNVVLSLRVTLASSPTFVAAILSATTQLFTMQTFVAVRYNFATGKVAIQGVPSATTPPLTLQNALQAVSGSSLKVPAGLGSLTQVTIHGREEAGVTTLAIRGKIGNTDTVSVILQKTASGTNAAFVADISSFSLASLAKTFFNTDIAALPVFGQVRVIKMGFSVASGAVTSSLIPTLYAPTSPLAKLGNTLPGGVVAYFTATLSGASVGGVLSPKKLSFTVPIASPLSVKQLLSKIPSLATSLGSLPPMLTNVLNTQLSSLDFNPVTKQLDISLSLKELVILPTFKLTAVSFRMSVVIDPPSIKTLHFSGTWTLQTLSMVTTLDYDGTNKVMNVKATPSAQTPLQVEALMKKLVAFKGILPPALSSVTVTTVMGSIYNNGNYFIAVSGTVSAGKTYLIFYKGADGVKVAAAASVQSFPLSSLFQTAGLDITAVPYFGTMTVPAMAVVLASGTIKSNTFPHLFRAAPPLAVYGNTLPAGLSSQFNINTGALKGAVARFSGDVLDFKLPVGVKLDITALIGEIKQISGAINTLPSQLKSIIGGASIDAFSFNATSKSITITASLATLPIVSGFLSISKVTLHFEGSFGKTVTVKALDFSGTWNIGGNYALSTSVVYDGATKELMVVGQSMGQSLNIADLVMSLVQKRVPLPKAVSSFTITGLTGRTAAGEFVVVLNGQIAGASGKVSAVFYKTANRQVGAIVVDIIDFRLSSFIMSATGTDISAVPFLGQLMVPELKFAVATGAIASSALAKVSTAGSALEWFKTGIVKGASGRFIVQIGQSKIAANFVGQKLDFKIPVTSVLSLNDVLTAMPPIKTIVSAVPPQLASVLNAKISDFGFDTTTLKLRFKGTLQTPIDIIPGLLSLTNVKITLAVDLGKKLIESVDFSGDWSFGGLAIATVVSYDRAKNTLFISGTVNPPNGVTIPNLITSLGGPTLTVPSILSSVKLSSITGNRAGGVTLVSLTGAVAGGSCFFFFQKSSAGAAVALAVDIPTFKFADLVASANGPDISTVPFFSTLTIPRIGLSIASVEIKNNMLSSIFPADSPLAKLGTIMPAGATASFVLSMGGVQGLIADFAGGKLNLQVPIGAVLTLASVVGQIPELKTLINSLPQPIQDLGNTQLSKLLFLPSTREFQVTGSLASLTVIPNFLQLQKIKFDFSVILGKGAQVKFVKFRGNWLFNSLSVTTEVFYERGLLLISGAPASTSTLKIKQFIKDLTNIDLNIPAALDALKVTKVVGKIQNGVLSLVLLGEIAGKAQVSIVFEHAQTGRIVAFAADVKQFKLSDLVLAGTTLDITAVPFFGNFMIPSVSFVLSSKQFSTANLPDMTNVGVPVPKELGLPTIPAGIAGKFLATIGNTAGLDASLVGKVLTIAVPPNVALSLSNLLTSIPEIQPVINSLPATVKDVINARIIQLVFNARTKNLLVSLELDTLTLIPQVVTITKLKISLDASLVAAQLVEIQERSLPLDERRGRSAMDTWSLPAEQRFENVFEQWFDSPTAAAYPLEQWFLAPTAETPNEDAAELDELPETRFPNGAPVLPHTPTSQDLPDSLKQWYEAPSAVTIPEVADDQAVVINALAITATWNVAGISIATTITYDKQTRVIRMTGVANPGQGVSIAGIIKVFTNTPIPAPSVLSSLKVINVVAELSDIETTIILTATAGGANVNANVYIIFQKKAKATAAAIAAEIQSFTIVDLVKTAANVDLAKVPFVSSFVSTVAFSASTDLITSPLAARTFASGGPLQRFAGKLPKGTTAHFEVQINGKAGVAVSYSGGKLTFTPPKAGLLLSDLLTEMPQAISSIVNSLPAPLSDLRITTISAIDFDAATKTLSATATIPQLTIIPTKMVVTDIQASFVAILSSTNGGLKSLDFTANWVLGTATVRMSVSYDKVKKVVVFSATPTQGLDIQQLIASLGSVVLPSAINTAKLTKIVGRKTGSGSTFIFSGTIANKAEVHLVYQVMGKSSQVGIAAGISSFTLDELVKSAATGISITGVPFFGTFSIPAIALAVAKQQLKTPLLPQVVPPTSPVAKYGSTIPGGFTAKFDAPAIGNVLGIVGSYDNKVLSFTVPPTVDASLGTLMSEFSNTFDVNAIGVGPVFGNLLTIKLKGFTLDLKKKAMTVNLFMGQVKFYENILTMRDIKLKLLATFSPVTLSAEASATISLGKIDYAVAVGRDAVTKKYELSISTPTLPITGFISSLGASFLPRDLQTLLAKALVFNVLNAKVVFPLAAKPPQMELSGNPELFGQTGAVLKAVAFKYSGNVVLVQKYNFPSFNLADLLQNLLGVSLHKLGFLNQNMDINFVLSPGNIKGVKLSLPDFQGFGLLQGMSFKVPKLPWPNNCASDPLCNTAKKLIGSLDLSLEGTITNLQSYVLTATVGDLKLGGGVVLLQAGLEFEGGVAPSVGIVGNIIFNPQITFQAAIRATPAGVKLEGSMTGCWNNAFGWDSLKICDLLLSVTIPLTGLEYGGKVVVGKPSCGQPLTAQGYVGINLLLPTENYFYADVGPVTFQKFFDAFCFSVALPQPLADSGFPNGFKTSASLGGVNLPNAGITIPSGFTFRGTFNILGLVTYINLRLQVTGIIADVKLPPVKIGSVLSMYLSSTDRKSGPLLHVEVVTSKPPIIEAQGFISVFGMELQSKLVISSNTYTLDLTGRFLKLFQARLLISATYSKKGITSGSFMVEGWFKSDLFAQIAKAVRNGLGAAAKDAKQKIDAAKAKVTEAQGKLDSVTATLTNAQRDVNNAKAKFKGATDAVGVAKQKVDGICQYKTCSSVCVGCITGITCCKKIFGVCVAPCPVWNSCCTRIPDPGCVAANAACALAKEPLLLTLNGAQTAVDKSKGLLDAANLVLEAAKGPVQLAKGVLDGVKVTLEGVKKLYIAGTKAASAILTYTLTKIISITEMYFRVELSVANGGRFQCRVKGTLVGQTINQSFMLDTRNILGIAKSIAEKAIAGVSKYIG